jgi:uncharacterized protein
MTYLPAGLPAPVTESDGLDLPYWEGTRQGVLKVQRCGACNTWQWGPEWLWHPVHAALRDHGPYIAALVELPHAGNIRMLGNLLGDPHQEVTIGSAVQAVFEPHDDAASPYTLVQWRIA